MPETTPPGGADGAEDYRVTRHQVIKRYYQQAADRRLLRRCIAAPSHFSDVVVPLGGLAVGDLAQSIATLTSPLPEWARRPTSPGAGRLGATLEVTEEDLAALDPLPDCYRGATVSPPEPPPGEVLERRGTGQGWTHQAMRRAPAAPKPAAPAQASTRKRGPRPPARSGKRKRTSTRHPPQSISNP